MEKGSFYFFTCTILDWKQALLDDDRKTIVVDFMHYMVSERLARISAFVVMPNHLHLLWQPLVENTQLRFMKYTAHQIKFHLKKNDPEFLELFHVNKTDRQYQIWQRNPLAVELYSREVVEQKLDYIHNNPCQVKWKLVTDPIDYHFSSMRFYEENDHSFSFLTHYMDIIG